MKLLGAEEEDLSEREGEMMGDLREGERRRIAAEEEIQEELLAERRTGNQIAAVVRETFRDRVVRRLRVFRERGKRRMQHGNGAHRRRRRNRCNEVKTELNRLAILPRQEEIADLASVILRTRCDLVAPRNHLVHHWPDPGRRFFLRQFSVPFSLGEEFPLAIYYYIGNGRIIKRFSRDKNESVEKAQ